MYRGRLEAGRQENRKKSVEVGHVAALTEQAAFHYIQN